MFLAYVFFDRNEKKFSKRHKNFKEICKMKNRALNKLLIAILVVAMSFATLLAVTSCFDSGSTSDSNGATTESNGGSGNSENSDSDSSSEISVCKNFADITGQFWVGGILGYALNVDILATDTENNNRITGVAGVGGIAGRARVVTGATNSGEIVATGYILESTVKKAYVGGIAGYCRGAINCTNNSDITVKTGGIEVGGIAGMLYIGASYWHQASGNVNNGKITGEDNVGGIFGSTVTYEGYDGHYYVEHNVNNAVITGENNVGGIVGVAIGGSYRDGGVKYRYIRFEYNENKAAIVATGKVAGIAASCTNVVTDEAIVNTNKTTYGNIFGQN